MPKTLTITSIAPNTGHVRGKYVAVITGTNFNLPPAPPATGPCPPVQPYCRVYFGTTVAKAKSVGVRTDPGNPTTGRILYCTVPAHAAVAVSVKVENLDSNGNPVAGESVTKTNAFTYQRPDLTRDSTLVRVIREMDRLIKEQVLANTYVSVSTDYDDTPDDDQNVTHIAGLPAVELIFDTVPWDRIAGTEESETTQAGDIGRKYKTPDTVDLEFTVLGLAGGNPAQMWNLLEATILFFRDNRMLEIQRDPDDATKGTKQFKVRPRGDAQTTGRGNNAGVFTFRQRWAIEAVDIEAFDVVEMTGIVEEAGAEATVVETESQQTGESYPVGVNPPNEGMHP